MVVAVSDAGVVDTLEARLEDARRRHEANKFGPNLLLAVIEASIRSVWAEEHPARPASPRSMNNEGGVDVGVNAGGDQVGSNAGGKSRQSTKQLSPMSATHVTASGMALSYSYFKFTPDKISVIPLLVGRPDILTWKEAIKPQLEMAGLIGFARGTVATPEEHYPDLHAEFCAVQLLTFMVILRCCSSGVQIALKSCREYLDAGHQEWHLIESMYQVTDALYIGQLEEQVSHIRMGEEETATDYCNRARKILATMRMAGAHYSTALYLKPTKDADKKSAKDSGRGGGSRRWECWLCGDPNHLSLECPDRSDSDDDDAKRGRGRSGSRRPRRGRNQPRKERQSTKSSTSAKDADSSAGGKRRRARWSASWSRPSKWHRRPARTSKRWRQQLHARLAHVDMNTIWSSAKHEVATGLDLKSASGAEFPCVSCVGGKLARHTFPDQSSDADDVLAVVHVDLCGPFRVAAKDGSLYFSLLKDRKTRYVWVRPVAKKSDALRESVQWLAVTERKTKESVLMLRSDWGGEFLGKQFTDFVNGKRIVHDLTCPYTPQQNGMAEREMRTVVESVRTMLLHMGMQHHWWHLALRQAVWVRNCLERLTL
ncbi:unnamed protein product [Closterium sp. NIES-53]